MSLDGIGPVGHSKSYAATTTHNLEGFEIPSESDWVDSALKASNVCSAADKRSPPPRLPLRAPRYGGQDGATVGQPSSWMMTLRERSTRTGLEIALETPRFGGQTSLVDSLA